MAETQRRRDVPDKREEAANLAKEAIEERQHGNTEEARFLAEEARELDASAAEAVLHEKDRKPAAKAKAAGQPEGGRLAGSEARRSGSSRGKSGGSAERRSATSEKRGGSAERTIDHATIRAWAEERKGRPSVVKRSHDSEEGGGILRIDFNEPEETLEEVPWDEFFEVFEDRQLAFLHQDRTADGNLSRFFKFVRRDQEDAEENQD